jgi:hypothetical protein
MILAAYFLMMKILFCIQFILLLFFVSCNQQPTAVEKLRGMWKLERFEMQDSMGHWVAEPSREGWTGYVLYDGLGHVGVHLSPKGYKDYDISKKTDSLNCNELMVRAKYFQSNYVYFANATVTDSAVVHHRLSATSPKDWGVEVTRDIELHNDTLIMITREAVGGIRLRVKWIKLP